MPVIEHYEENPQILKDCNQIDIDISKECFTQEGEKPTPLGVGWIA